MNWIEDFEEIQEYISGIESYTDKEVEDRCVALFDAYIGLKKAFSWGDEVSLNSALLLIAVKSYYEDIFRLKLYHKIQRVDTHKKAAFTLKWIAKIRPICLTRDTDLDGTQINVNEIFAVWAGLNFLDDFQVQDVPRNLYDSLLYSASYRDIDPKQLAQTMYLLERNGRIRKGMESAFSPLEGN